MPPAFPADLVEQTPADAASAPAEDDATLTATSLSVSSERFLALVAYVAEMGEWAAAQSNPARISALEEQQALVWWLESSATGGKCKGAAVAAVVAACDELLSLARTLPGPPAAPGLLRRRLASLASKPVMVAAVAAAARRPVPPIVEDLCLLVAGRVGDDSDAVERSASDVARQLYTELVLIGLVEGSQQ